MKRERPPMPPLSVRIKVAEDQVFRTIKVQYSPLAFDPKPNGTAYLKILLGFLFDKPQLDHDPALILRKYNPRIKDVAARYTPHAHDPAFLIYREKAEHLEKTIGRRADAEKTVTTKGSDIWLKSKFNRLEGRTKKRPKTKWPKGRKLQGRKFQ